MTGRQRRRVLVDGVKWSLGALVLLPFTGRCVQMNVTAFGDSYDDLGSRLFEQGLILLFGVVLVLLFGVAVTGAFGRLVDGAGGRARTVEGEIRTRTEISRNTYWGDLRHPHVPRRTATVRHYVAVGEYEFAVDRQAVDAIPRGRGRAYHAPLSHLLLSIEPASEGDRAAGGDR